MYPSAWIPSHNRSYHPLTLSPPLHHCPSIFFIRSVLRDSLSFCVFFRSFPTLQQNLSLASNFELDSGADFLRAEEKWLFDGFLGKLRKKASVDQRRLRQFGGGPNLRKEKSKSHQIHSAGVWDNIRMYFLVPSDFSKLSRIHHPCQLKINVNLSLFKLWLILHSAFPISTAENWRKL